MLNAFKFPRTARLTRPDEFNRVFKQAKTIKFREFNVYVRQNRSDQARLGLAVSKKAVRNAVKRNFLKRIIRESFRHKQKTIVGWDVVFVARRAANDSDAEQVRKLTVIVWKQITT